MVETAIILAAGQGSKIWPYNQTWAKAALPIANRPLIEWQVEALKKCGVNNFLIVTGHLAGQIQAALTGYESIQCIEQKKLTGTSNALLIVLAFVKDDEFLVLHGDVLFDESDLRSLSQIPLNNNECAALVKPLGNQPSTDWLCADVEGQSIRQIKGHPREATHQLCGIYKLSRNIIPYLAANPGYMTSVEVGNMPPQEAELAESLNLFIHKNGHIHAVECQSFFVDIDKPWHLLEANTTALNHMATHVHENRIAPSATVENEAEIQGHIVVGEGSFISRDVKIKGNAWIGKHSKITDGAIIGANTVIGDHSSIREYCKIEPLSAIGNHCVIGHAAEFGGLMLDGAYSYHYGEYWGIIGRSADLGAATVCGNLRFDDQNTIHRIKGRREITPSEFANAAYLGDYTRTGVNAILMPGVKVGPYSIIGPGVILYQDLPSKTLIQVKQTLETKPWGPERYGW